MTGFTGNKTAEHVRTARELAEKASEEIMAGETFHYEAADAVKLLIRYCGDNPEREGLLETPDRVLKAYHHLFGGYREDVMKVVKTFKEGACDEMVISKGIEFYSHCEHHMMPFFGKAHIAYIPKGRIIGLSKLARILDIYAKRLQVQERLTTEVTAALDTHLQPLGSACVIEAQHFCCMARGVGKQSSKMVTSSLTGVFRDGAVRSEFFNLIKS